MYAVTSCKKSAVYIPQPFMDNYNNAKANLTQQILTRIARLLLVSYLSFYLYPYLVDFVKENNTILHFSFMVASIIIIVITIVIGLLYNIIKRFLFGDHFDSDHIFVFILYNALVTLLLVIIAIGFQERHGIKLTVLVILGWEIIGYLRFINKEKTEESSENSSE